MKHQEISFKEYLFRNKRNKAILLIAGAAIVTQFTIFKWLYPYASFIHADSFSYINSAYFNLDINTYMVGYSRFLRLFSVFTSSDTALVAFQYLFIESSALFLLFTLFYLYKPSKTTQIILLSFMILNPLFLHLANLISSDCIFAALSLEWFALLLWIVHFPSVRPILWHTLVLFIVFTFRYNALIYPFISAGAFCLSKLPLIKKIVGIVAGVLLCGYFVLYTSYKYRQLTGKWQYSPFSGWQLTNNAMYAYRYVDSANRKPVPKRFQALDKMVRTYFDSTRDIKKHPVESLLASTVYMWDPSSTLYKYRNNLFEKDSSASELKKWAYMGPLYKDYGLYIIKQYPIYYARYFLWPNANKYYAPPVEFLGYYNSGMNYVTPETKSWFHYNSQVVKTRMENNEVWILDFYPILSGIINVVIFCSLICYSILRGWRYDMVFAKTTLLGAMVWFLNAAFTICASSAALRFQSFPILLTATFAMLLVDWLWNMASQNTLSEGITNVKAFPIEKETSFELVKRTYSQNI